MFVNENDLVVSTKDNIITNGSVIRNSFINAYESYYMSDDAIKACAQNYDKIEKEVEKIKKQKEEGKKQAIYRKNKRLRHLIKHVHWSGNTCIVYWMDGTQTKAHWDSLEFFDPEKAILVCMARKLYEGTNIYNEVLRKYSEDGWDHYEKNLVETWEDDEEYFI